MSWASGRPGSPAASACRSLRPSPPPSGSTWPRTARPRWRLWRPSSRRHSRRWPGPSACAPSPRSPRTTPSTTPPPGPRRRRSGPRSRQTAAPLILYTSGTTSRPKGVVLTHDNLEAEITCLIHAWGWTAADCVLHVLPLNHTHGLINVLSCALWSGAVCEMAPAFDPVAVWNRLASGDLTLFMAVPTIYHRLICGLARRDARPAAAVVRRRRRAAALRLRFGGAAGPRTRAVARRSPATRSSSATA